MKRIDRYNLFPKNIEEASIIQSLLKKDLIIKPLRKKPAIIAGVDASYKDNKIIGVCCIFRYPEMDNIESSFSIVDVSFPYVPGYLTFREGPAIISAIKKTKEKVDVIIFDGQGIAHPKGIGIASHIGILLNKPTIGCAKSCLIGEFKKLGRNRGDSCPLVFDKKIVGVVLRTRDNIRPIFVSPGHLIDIEGSKEIVLNCCKRFRLPEPIRCADKLSRIMKKQIM